MTDIRETRDPELLATVYREVLRPSFPRDELGDEAPFVASLAAGNGAALVAFDGDVPVAAAIAETFDAPVVLLAYLAARPGVRGLGLGGQLYRAAVDTWAERWRPCLVLAEIEPPDGEPSDPDHGDTSARVRFYARRGARRLDVPYFQPAVEGGKRVPVMLAVAHADDALSGPEPASVDVAVVRAFVLENLQRCEGGVAEDPEVRALITALDDPGSGRLLPLEP